ncbi:uncharacterized protein LOC131860315 [Cryptomeria japonica]|uniref:uncharacterized protein LOC131860315 n=1 Tax=Cryptomeria japonica TaxID=3369 RepID=UPI0027DA34DB|nr:uncharacterized protein LOC131860315 [Cryptomeria japonica]
MSLLKTKKQKPDGCALRERKIVAGQGHRKSGQGKLRLGKGTEIAAVAGLATNFCRIFPNFVKFLYICRIPNLKPEIRRMRCLRSRLFVPPASCNQDSITSCKFFC